jgi:MarR family transcriptional regulator, organic hydroperoxide resistance regulator
MARRRLTGPVDAGADLVIARLFVDVFDGLIRQVIVPNSHKAAQNLQMGPQDVRALIWLGRRERCLMTDFAKGVGIPLSTATHLANRLVEKGVVLRERSEQDRRVVSICLSALGKKLDSHFFQLRLSRSQALLARLKLGEQQKLVALMQKALAEAGEPVPTRTKEEKK